MNRGRMMSSKEKTQSEAEKDKQSVLKAKKPTPIKVKISDSMEARSKHQQTSRPTEQKSAPNQMVEPLTSLGMDGSRITRYKIKNCLEDSKMVDPFKWLTAISADQLNGISTNADIFMPLAQMTASTRKLIMSINKPTNLDDPDLFKKITREISNEDEIEITLYSHFGFADTTESLKRIERKVANPFQLFLLNKNRPGLLSAFKFGLITPKKLCANFIQPKCLDTETFTIAFNDRVVKDSKWLLQTAAALSYREFVQTDDSTLFYTALVRLINGTCKNILRSRAITGDRSLNPPSPLNASDVNTIKSLPSQHLLVLVSPDTDVTIAVALAQADVSIDFTHPLLHVLTTKKKKDFMFDFPLKFLPKKNQHCFILELLARVQRTDENFEEETNQSDLKNLEKTTNVMSLTLGTQIAIIVLSKDENGNLIPFEKSKTPVCVYKICRPYFWPFNPNSNGANTIRLDLFLFREDEPYRALSQSIWTSAPLNSWNNDPAKMPWQSVLAVNDRCHNLDNWIPCCSQITLNEQTCKELLNGFIISPFDGDLEKDTLKALRRESGWIEMYLYPFAPFLSPKNEKFNVQTIADVYCDPFLMAATATNDLTPLCQTRKVTTIFCKESSQETFGNREHVKESTSFNVPLCTQLPQKSPSQSFEEHRLKDHMSGEITSQIESLFPIDSLMDQNDQCSSKRKSICEQTPNFNITNDQIQLFNQIFHPESPMSHWILAAKAAYEVKLNSLKIIPPLFPTLTPRRSEVISPRKENRKPGQESRELDTCIQTSTASLQSPNDQTLPWYAGVENWTEKMKTMHASSSASSSYLIPSTMFSKQNLPNFRKRMRSDSGCSEQTDEPTAAYWKSLADQNNVTTSGTVELGYIEPGDNHLPIQMLRRSCMFVCGFRRELRDTSNENVRLLKRCREKLITALVNATSAIRDWKPQMYKIRQLITTAMANDEIVTYIAEYVNALTWKSINPQKKLDWLFDQPTTYKVLGRILVDECKMKFKNGYGHLNVPESHEEFIEIFKRIIGRGFKDELLKDALNSLKSLALEDIC